MQGLVGTPHLPVAHMLLSAAAKCAHLVAPLAGAGVSSPTGESRGFHGSGTPALQRLQEAGRWPTLAGDEAQAPNPHALRWLAWPLWQGGHRTWDSSISHRILDTRTARLLFNVWVDPDGNHSGRHLEYRHINCPAWREACIQHHLFPKHSALQSVCKFK